MNRTYFEKTALFLLGIIAVLSTSLHVSARDFEYTYKDQTLKYTVINETARTVSTKSGGSYKDRNNKTHTYAGNEIEGELILPETVSDGTNTYTLVEIGAYGFYNNKNLSYVILPYTVNKVGKDAFDGCELHPLVVSNPSCTFELDNLGLPGVSLVFSELIAPEEVIERLGYSNKAEATIFAPYAITDIESTYFSVSFTVTPVEIRDCFFDFEKTKISNIQSPSGILNGPNADGKYTITCSSSRKECIVNINWESDN